MNTQKSDDYPTLAEMGIASPKQIANFYLTSINQIDVLRVVYERPEGTFLPATRSYKFPRIVEKGTESASRTHPTLLAALEELQAILESKSSAESIALYN